MVPTLPVRTKINLDGDVIRVNDSPLSATLTILDKVVCLEIYSIFNLLINESLDAEQNKSILFLVTKKLTYGKLLPHCLADGFGLQLVVLLGFFYQLFL